MRLLDGKGELIRCGVDVLLCVDACLGLYTIPDGSDGVWC